MGEPQAQEQIDPYPEHTKLRAVSDVSQRIGEFLEWLQNDKHVSLCTLEDIPETEEAWPREQYFPIRKSIQQILAEFFEIDLDVIETEKRAMLDEIRRNNNA